MGRFRQRGRRLAGIVLSCFPRTSRPDQLSHPDQHRFPDGFRELTESDDDDSNARFRGQRGPNSPGESLAPSPTTSFAETNQSAPTAPNLQAKLPPLPNSSSLADSIGMEQPGGMIPSAEEILASYHLPVVKPLWLNANYAKHIVKGNFLTLSAKPKTVEMGEWVAHQGESACSLQTARHRLTYK